MKWPSIVLKEHKFCVLMKKKSFVGFASIKKYFSISAIMFA